MIHDWSIPGADGQPILGNTHVPEERPEGVLLIAHGFKGYKDYGFFPFLARAAAMRGLVAHRFNFSHSGMTNRIDTFERPDLFEQDTWGKQIQDLGLVARAAADGTLPGPGSEGPIVWFGHSRGGVTALLTASRVFHGEALPGTPRPGALVCAAAPHVACNLDDSQRTLLHRQGYLESPSSRTGQELRLGRRWLEEMEADEPAFDPLKAIALIPCPVLLVHGAQDSTVPVEAATLLRRAGGPQVALEVIPGATHTFNAPNPLGPDAEPPPETERFVQTVCDFAVRQGGKGSLRRFRE